MVRITSPSSRSGGVARGSTMREPLILDTLNEGSVSNRTATNSLVENEEIRGTHIARLESSENWSEDSSAPPSMFMQDRNNTGRRSFISFQHQYMSRETVIDGQRIPFGQGAHLIVEIPFDAGDDFLEKGDKIRVSSVIKDRSTNNRPVLIANRVISDNECFGMRRKYEFDGDPLNVKEEDFDKLRSIDKDYSCLLCWAWQCWCLRLILCLAAVIVPMYFFLSPCIWTMKEIHPPVDLMFMLDESSSMSPESWQTAKEAAAEWVQGFNNSLDALQVGVIQFSSHAEMGMQLETNISKVLEDITELEQGSGFTNYYEAMTLMETEVEERRMNDSYVMGVLITDGEPTMDIEYMYEMAEYLKNDLGYTMMIILVTEMEEADKVGPKIFNLTSCGAMDYILKDSCVWYGFAYSFDILKQQISRISNEVLTNIEKIDETCPITPWWFIAVMLCPCCCSFLCLFCFVTLKKVTYEEIDDFKDFYVLNGDKLVTEIQNDYGQYLKCLHDKPKKHEVDELEKVSNDYHRRLQDKVNEKKGAYKIIDRDIKDGAAEIARLDRELREAEDIARRFWESKEKVFSLLADRKTTALLKSMIKPPPVLLKLTSCAIMLTDKKPLEKNWALCKKFLLSEGFKLDDNDFRTIIPEEVLDKVTEIMRQYVPSLRRAKRAAGDLGAALHAFILNMIEFQRVQAQDIEEQRERLAYLKHQYYSTLREKQDERTALKKEIKYLKKASKKMQTNIKRIREFKQAMDKQGDWSQVQVLRKDRRKRHERRSTVNQTFNLLLGFDQD